jgi:hypothetical protein
MESGYVLIDDATTFAVIARHIGLTGCVTLAKRHVRSAGDETPIRLTTVLVLLDPIDQGEA